VVCLAASTAPELGYTLNIWKILGCPMSYQNIITIEPGKRGGKPCIRRMRITVYDVLGWLAVGMSQAEIIDDFPELTTDDITACLEFVADRERRLVAVVGAI
jgi:uncharacterized protein (DUF433 family)